MDAFNFQKPEIHGFSHEIQTPRQRHCSKLLTGLIAGLADG
jgi:hypothetical protein